MLSTESINSQLQNLDQQLGWPNIVSVQHVEMAYELQLSIPSNLEVFAGHFPEEPVLPGILQVHWAVALAEICFDRTLGDGFNAMKGIKFNSMVVPSSELRLSLKLQNSRLAFSYWQRDIKYSNGSLVFNEESP